MQVDKTVRLEAVILEAIRLGILDPSEVKELIKELKSA